jgi:hypothetical protein
MAQKVHVDQGAVERIDIGAHGPAPAVAPFDDINIVGESGPANFAEAVFINQNAGDGAGRQRPRAANDDARSVFGLEARPEPIKDLGFGGRRPRSQREDGCSRGQSEASHSWRCRHDVSPSAFQARPCGGPGAHSRRNEAGLGLAAAPWAPR